MQILLYILGVLTMIMAGFVLTTASNYKFRHLGLTLGGLAYLIAGILTVHLLAWWPLIVGWLAAFGIKKLFGDPSQ